MLISIAGLCAASMVGPLPEPVVETIRIHRPGGVEVVVPQTIGRRVDGAIVLPTSATSGAGVTVVGELGKSETGFLQGGWERPLGVTTEQLWRSFDHSRFGYTIINYPRPYGHGHHPGQPVPPPDPVLEQLRRNLAPIESRFPPAPGR